MRAIPIVRGGQRGWAHDEGHTAGSFETFDALDLGDGPPRKVHVLVPRGQGPWTLLVQHDGHTTFWPPGSTWDVAATLSALPVGPVLVVAVHPIDRNAEYTHADWASGTRTWGGLPAYARWIAERLVPWVRATWPTSDRATAVGSSHGGLAAFWCATRHPDVFGAAGCLSPSFFSGLDDLSTGALGDVALRDSPLVAPVIPVLADPALRPRLWLCWGLRRDGGEHNAIVEALATTRGEEMADLLVDLGYREGVDLWAVEERDAGHDESAWRRRFGWMATRLLGGAR
jgi:pimeloyl-ACP methyl ester carboxylesterase